jgi:TonB family protein
MALREKLGRLVLLEETEVGVLGREYRAARLGPTGLDRLVTVLCFAPGVSSQAAVTKRLMDEARLAARLQNPGLVRVLGIGRVEQTFYISTELVEGRTLSAIFERCQRESFPFAADHALMVASRVASALEYLHGKKDDSGTKLFHGLLTPSKVVVSYDGEVKLKGLGLWSALREAELLEPAERLYLAPEQAGTAGDPRSDVYALGLILLHALTGRAPDGGDPRMALAEAKVVNVSGEASPVPKLLAETLGRALAEDPADRYASMADMRKAIDTLLFSGDFTPTTFDLAFFMHTLFRDDMDHESRAIDEARRADYREFLEPEAPKTGSGPAVTPAPSPLGSGELPVVRPVTPAPETATTRPLTAETPVVTPKPEPPPPRPTSSPALPLIPPPAPKPVIEPIAASPSAHAPEPPAAEAPRPFTEPSHSGSASFADVRPAEHRVEHHASRDSGSRSGREASARDASMRLTLGAPAPQAAGRSKLWLGIVGAVVLIGVGVGAWVFLGRPAPAPTPPPLTPEAAAAMARVKELEQRIAAIDKQRADAEAAAAAEAEKKLKAEAERKGRAVDAAAVAKAQEEARAKARAEQEARQQQEMRRLAEAKKAEEARLAAEMRAAAESTPVPAPPTTVAAAPPTTAAAAASAPETQPSPSNAPPQPGSLVSITDPKLVPPLQLSGNPPVFPPLAAQQRIEGSVDLSALIDENGRVAEVTVLRAKPKNVGFELAASQSVRSRRYRPGTKDGVPVKVWVTIAVQFKRAR